MTLPFPLRNLIAPLTRHWRGEYALLPTILITVLTLRFLTSSIPVQEDYTEASGVILLSGILLIWQVVGTWRSANADIVSYGNPSNVWLAYGAMAIALFMTSVQIVDQLSGKPPFSIWLKGYGDDRLLAVGEAGKTVKISGSIDYDTRAALDNTLSRTPGVKTVHLNSDGGLIYAARLMARRIETDGLDTHVEGQCLSACTLIFMAGKTRTIGKGAKLGFHSYKFGQTHPLSEASETDEQAIDIGWFRTRGISERFLEQIYRTPHSEIWQPDHKSLLAAGVLTE